MNKDNRKMDEDKINDLLNDLGKNYKLKEMIECPKELCDLFKNDMVENLEKGTFKEEKIIDFQMYLAKASDFGVNNFGVGTFYYENRLFAYVYENGEFMIYADEETTTIVS